MTEPDNFILRWARLKREAHIDREVDNRECVTGSSREPQQAAAIEPEGTSVRPRNDAAASETFDLSSLPSIESITSETDVRGFLQSSVPRELTIAALRRAWTSDPAIRDFIGIAENQWDFTDPGAIPGFGSLESGDVAALLRQAVGQGLGQALPSPVPAVAAPSAPQQSAPPSAQVHGIPDRNAGDGGDRPAVQGQQNVVLAAAQHPSPPAVPPRLPSRRTHGGARPK